MKLDMVPRYVKDEQRDVIEKLVHVCICPKMDRIGKDGAFCKKCGDAIPTQTERYILFVERKV